MTSAQRMDPVIFEDSPLASYLEGEGERDQEWAPVQAQQMPPLLQPSFAPYASSTLRTRLRNRFARPPRLLAPATDGPRSKIQNVFSSAANSSIGRVDTATFLEQFRYPIVASQLLSDHTALPIPKPVDPSIFNPLRTGYDSFDAEVAAYGLKGAVATGTLSFLVVWVIHWTRSPDGSLLEGAKSGTALIILATVVTLIYFYARRRYLARLRHQAIEGAAALIRSSQSFDSTSSAAVTLIQEVELVSRGYSLCTPLPPISRLEEGGQTRYCNRLRRCLSESLQALVQQYSDAYHLLQPLVALTDIEMYYDIYEIDQLELQAMICGVSEVEVEDTQTLKSLKLLLKRLHFARKVVFCCLLALEADGARSDFAKWSSVLVEVQALASLTQDSVESLSAILGEEDDREISDHSPKLAPGTGGDQRGQARTRRLNSLSQGIRALHAKIHLLREESDAGLDTADRDSTFCKTLVSRYDSIGVDLRALLQEWEVGKAALSLSSATPKRWSSHSSNGLRSPNSPTVSLGGRTAVGGSPSDALKALNGEDLLLPSIDASLSDEEIFEAIAQPRKRMSMTREEKMARMKEDRVRQSSAREKADANTNMLRELETVIKLRPHRRVSSRVTSL